MTLADVSHFCQYKGNLGFTATRSRQRHDELMSALQMLRSFYVTISTFMVVTAYEGAYTEKKLAVNALYCIHSFIFECAVYALLSERPLSLPYNQL